MVEAFKDVFTVKNWVRDCDLTFISFYVGVGDEPRPR